MRKLRFFFHWPPNEPSNLLFETLTEENTEKAQGRGLSIYFCIPLLKTRPSTQTTILGISVKFYYLSKSKKNKLKMFNIISKPHKKNMAFKSRLRLNISSCIAAFWSSPPFVRAKSCDFELIVPGWEDWNLKKGIFFINIQWCRKVKNIGGASSNRWE